MADLKPITILYPVMPSQGEIERTAPANAEP